MSGRKDDTKLFKGKAVTPLCAAAVLNPPTKEDFARMRQIAEVEYPAAQQAAQLRGLFDATGDMPAFVAFCKEHAPPVAAAPTQAPPAATSGAEQGAEQGSKAPPAATSGAEQGAPAATSGAEQGSNQAQPPRGKRALATSS